MKRAFVRGLAATAAGLVLSVAAGCGQRQAPPAKDEGVGTVGGAPETAAVAAAVENAAIPADALRIGDAITVATAPVTLAQVRANPPDFFEKTLLIEGTAAAVCQAKGCWMTITDGQGEPIWVRWSTGCGGTYAFPKDCAGRHVVLQGSFYPKEISPADAEHIAAESGTMKAEDIAGKTFEINATACVVLPQAAGTEAPAVPAEGAAQAG